TVLRLRVSRRSREAQDEDRARGQTARIVGRRSDEQLVRGCRQRRAQFLSRAEVTGPAQRLRELVDRRGAQQGGGRGCSGPGRGGDGGGRGARGSLEEERVVAAAVVAEIVDLDRVDPRALRVPGARVGAVVDPLGPSWNDRAVGSEQEPDRVEAGIVAL